MDDLKTILKTYWGFDSFRPLQEDIIQAVLATKDVLALLPTGGGKSLCFQVPALMMEGICLVVSPLIALMKDQVEHLKNKGIPALAIYSGMDFPAVKKTLQQAAFGNYKFLYVSPERLETSLFLEFLPAIKPSLLAIDEAHCISQWGYDFRPPYLRIADLRKELKGVPVIALTASATPEVQDDICEKLLYKKDHLRFCQSFARPNLSYSVFQPASKQTKLVEILKKVPGSAIVYCRSRKQTQQITDLLKMNGISAGYYHAGLSNDQRSEQQQKWVSNNTRVMVSTNAFGMGIDKPDVRAVVHYDVPDCLENYYQEAGRAGRDEKKAYAVLLHSSLETDNLTDQIDIRFPSAEEVKKVYIALMNYLQVPAGIGEWQSFDFDIASFADNFKLNILQATYAIQVLAKEDILSYNEIFFKPSTLVFTTDKNELREFEISEPALEPLIKGLLRSYEGIFDYPVTIYESLLSRFTKTSLEEVKAGLTKLHKYGIVHFQPQKDKPQIFLLKNRMYADDFKIDHKGHQQRKETYRKRIEAITAYVNNSDTCRSRQIGSYFGDKETPSCNICDNCLANKNKVLSESEFKGIADQIISTLLAGQVQIKELESLYKSGKKEKFWKVLDFLRAEDKIGTDREGFLFLR